MFRKISLSVARFCGSLNPRIRQVTNTFSLPSGFDVVRTGTEVSRWNKCVFSSSLVRHYCESGNDNSEGGEKEGNKTKERDDDEKDRSVVIPPETSIRYLKSKAYHETYQEMPVWVLYRRNFKGGKAPRTRKTCIRKNRISTGSPCPICRDKYLVLDYTNVALLKQFICPYTGEVYPTDKTGLCQKQHEKLLIAIDRAKDYGFISFEVPFRKYNYKEFYKQLSSC